MSLKRRFSCFSRLAHVFRSLSFSFLLRDALAPSPLPSPPFPENLRPVLARAVAAPLNWIFPVSLTSYCTRCHSTYGCQRSRGFSPPTSHLTRQRQPCVRTFFFSARWIFAIRESGFLSDPYRRSRSPFMHQCRSGRPVSSATIMSQVTSACISPSLPPSPPPSLFYRRILPSVCVSAHNISSLIANFRIIAHVISHVFPRVMLLLFLSLHPVRSFCALSRVVSARSIYGVFTFSRGSSTPPSCLFSSRLLLPHRA